MSKSPKITAKNLANIETVAVPAFVALEESQAKADGTKSDVYALFASAVLVTTGNIAGDRKGTEVRKSIAKVATDGSYKYSKGSLSKAEQVLSALVVEQFGEQDNYTAEQYAEAYDALIASGRTLWSVYENDEDDEEGEDGEGDEGKSGWSLAHAFATAIAKARKEGITDEEIIEEFGRQIAGA